MEKVIVIRHGEYNKIMYGVQNVLYMMWSVVMYSVTFRQLTGYLYQVPARLSALILQHQPLIGAFRP